MFSSNGKGSRRISSSMVKGDASDEYFVCLLVAILMGMRE